MVTTDFALKAAYIDGAQAARSGMELDQNPFREDDKRDLWILGYRTAATGSPYPVSYLEAGTNRP